MIKDKPNQDFDELPHNDWDEPPNFEHFGYRPNEYPIKSYRWWKTNWNGQFDIIPPEELNTRINQSTIAVFNYEQRLWD